MIIHFFLGLTLMTYAAVHSMQEILSINYVFCQKNEQIFVIDLSFQNRHNISADLSSLFSSAYVFFWSKIFSSKTLHYPPSLRTKILTFANENDLNLYIDQCKPSEFSTSNHMDVILIRRNIIINNNLTKELIIPFYFHQNYDRLPTLIECKSKTIELRNNLYEDIIIKKQLDSSLIELNDDCLLHIFEYLQFKDLIAMSKTNTRFHDIVSHILLQGFEVSTNSFKSFELLENFLKLFGKKIVNLKITNCPKFISEADYHGFIAQYLEDNFLISLNIKIDYKHSLDSVNVWNNKIKNVKKLRIIGTSPYETIFNQINILLHHASNVHSIEFTEMGFSPLAIHFYQCIHLKELIIKKCNELCMKNSDFEHFIKMIGFNLTKLELIDFNQRSRCICEQYQKNLELFAMETPNLNSFTLIDNEICHNDDCEYHR